MKRIAVGIVIAGSLIFGMASNAFADGLCDKAPEVCEIIEPVAQHVPVTDDTICVTVWVGDTQYKVCIPLYS